MNEPAASLKISVSLHATHGAGDVVLVGARSIDVQVLGPNGEPAADADVLVRDKEATRRFGAQVQDRRIR